MKKTPAILSQRLGVLEYLTIPASPAPPSSRPKPAPRPAERLPTLYFRKGAVRHARLESITAQFCAATGLSLEELRGPERTGEIAWARQVWHWLLRTLTACSLNQIARFAARDHGTIHHSVRAAESNIALYPSMAAEAHALRAQIQKKLKVS